MSTPSHPTPIVADQPIGLVLTTPPETAYDPSTGICISVIKTGSEDNMTSLSPTPKTIESEVDEPGNESDETNE